MPPLEGRRALITGGSRGLGRSIAVCLATHGADIGIVGRDAAELERTKTLVTDTGRQCIAIEADLATVDGARAAGEAALAHSDRWDVLVNNAGIALTASLLDVDAETWDRTMAVNLRAALLMAQAVAPGMLQRRAGKIINVSSLGAFLATPNLGAYTASKAALNALTRTTANVDRNRQATRRPTTSTACRSRSTEGCSSSHDSLHEPPSRASIRARRGYWRKIARSC